MDIRIPSECKKFREDHGFKSRQEFADKIGVYYKTVQGWENEKKPVQISLDNALAICEKFDCSLDYLVGKIEQRTHDIKTACELTGLSEAAIEKISRGKPYKTKMMVTLSKLIETKGFSQLTMAYRRFLDSAEKLKESALEQPPNQSDNIETVILSREEATRYFMRAAADAMLFICEDEFNKSYKMAMNNEQKKLEEEAAYIDKIESGDE